MSLNFRQTLLSQENIYSVIQKSKKTGVTRLQERTHAKLLKLPLHGARVTVSPEVSLINVVFQPFQGLFRGSTKLPTSGRLSHPDGWVMDLLVKPSVLKEENVGDKKRDLHFHDFRFSCGSILVTIIHDFSLPYLLLLIYFSP